MEGEEKMTEREKRKSKEEKRENLMKPHQMGHTLGLPLTCGAAVSFLLQKRHVISNSS